MAKKQNLRPSKPFRPQPDAINNWIMRRTTFASSQVAIHIPYTPTLWGDRREEQKNRCHRDARANAFPALILGEAALQIILAFRQGVLHGRVDPENAFEMFSAQQHHIRTIEWKRVHTKGIKLTHHAMVMMVMMVMMLIVVMMVMMMFMIMTMVMMAMMVVDKENRCGGGVCDDGDDDDDDR